MAHGFGLHPRMMASLWRGGTSKGLFVTRRELQHMLQQSEFRPGLQLDSLESYKALAPMLSPIMGSPDISERQLDGLGGGISSLRNLTAAVGPCLTKALLNKHILEQPDLTHATRIRDTLTGNKSVCLPLTVNLFNENTRKIIRSTFMVRRFPYQESWRWLFEPRGNFLMPGLPVPGSEVRLQWLDPGGSKTNKTLPTGNSTDTITVNGKQYSVSLVDISNPGIFVDGRQFECDSSDSPTELDARTDLMRTLDDIRCAGTQAMGLDPNDKAVPKIVMVFPPSSGSHHIDCLALSMQKAHKAVPGTLAMNLGAACQIEGTIPSRLSRKTSNGKIVIGHPSGTAETSAKITKGHVEYVEISRTARGLMQGYVMPAFRDYEVEEAS
ncbi:putative isomerase YraM [Cyphellophora attinorum]|uniref:Putative isomerase YraM n=1 Tax=Cyphellophora attinorum TaxID=1664694 RepID=A0A0N0NJQ9_9EURO|nr:putative isomerase YraM [Phialophora attinorum]KPI37178.1 putative isomerase YraM [Phialophora attinorum]